MSTERERLWATGYQATLYEQLVGELGAGWWTVTPLHPEDHPEPCKVRAENVVPIRVTRHWESRSWDRRAIS